jgi:GNAT superfamily N-acetyltransferase
MSVRIRRAEPSDAAVLTAIAFAAKRYWEYPEEWLGLWADELTVDPEYIGTHETWVAEDETCVLGWCALSRDEDAASLDHCWVKPDAIGRGIGRTLVQQAGASAAGLRLACLDVISDPHAEAFYRKLGFRRIGEHPSKPEGRTLPVLSLSLRP